jgi:hypothetical protein
MTIKLDGRLEYLDKRVAARGAVNSSASRLVQAILDPCSVGQLGEDVVKRLMLERGFDLDSFLQRCLQLG